MNHLQNAPASVEALDDALSDPPEALVEMFRTLPGDILVLGVAGKMGPTLARMAKRAATAGGDRRRVIGVARFSNPDEQKKLEAWDIQTIRCDLLDEQALTKLPDAPNVVFMAGMKFGSTGKEALTWAMNTHLPALVCKRFASSRIAAFSTGNVYGLAPLSLGGSIESDVTNPAGEYAMSCLGRERMFQHFSETLGTKVSILRLNYACEFRYGVLVDLARKVWANEAIDLAMGNFNVVWQADANYVALASLADAASPALILNIAGPELLSVRRVCQQIGERMRREPTFVGSESGDALLNNAQLSHRLYGYPRVSAEQLIHHVADWVSSGGASLGKPTHFESRSGKF